MRDALREYLEKPDQYLDEMITFLWDEFDAYITKPMISIVD